MMKPSLQLKLGQQLTMTPQLQQAIRLLQMPALELQAHIREQLESNVMLEPVEETKPPACSKRSNRIRMPEEKRVDAQAARRSRRRGRSHRGRWSERSAGLRDAWRDDDERAAEVADDVQAVAAGSPGRAARVRAPRAARARHRPRHRRCDQRRRLPHRVARRDRGDAAARGRRGRRRGRARARLVQTLDPPGVGARIVGECIELQLRSWIRTRPGLRLALADRRQAPRAGRRPRALAAAPRAARRRRRARRGRSRWCAPAIRARAPPSAAATAEYVVPDVFVRRTRSRLGRRDERCHAAARAPEPELRRHDRPQRRATPSMRAQLQEARWLLKSLEIRNETLMKVARSHRRAADRLPRAGRGAHAADDPQGHRRGHRDARIDDLARHLRQVHAHAARRVRAAAISSRARSRAPTAPAPPPPRSAPRSASSSRKKTPATPLSDGRIAELLSGEGIPSRAARSPSTARRWASRPPTSARKAARHDEAASVDRPKKETHHAIVAYRSSCRSHPVHARYVEKKLERIARHFDHVIDVHCVLTVEKLDRRPKPRCTSAATPSMPTPPRQHVRRHRPAGRQARPLRDEAQGKEGRPSRRRSAQGRRGS